MVGIVIKTNTKCHQKEHKHQYHVEMPHSPPTNNVEHEEHVINLDYPTPVLKQQEETQPNFIQEAINFHNLFSLPHLPTR
jgi:hypothetical protein